MRQTQYLPHMGHVNLSDMKRLELMNGCYFPSITTDIVCMTTLPTICVMWSSQEIVWSHNLIWTYIRRSNYELHAFPLGVELIWNLSDFFLFFRSHLPMWIKRKSMTYNFPNRRSSEEKTIYFLNKKGCISLFTLFFV